MSENPADNDEEVVPPAIYYPPDENAPVFDTTQYEENNNNIEDQKDRLDPTTQSSNIADSQNTASTPKKKKKKKKSNKIAPDIDQSLTQSYDGSEYSNNSFRFKRKGNSIALDDSGHLLPLYKHSLDGSSDEHARALPKLPDGYKNSAGGVDQPSRVSSGVSRHILYEDVIPPIANKRRPKSRQRDMSKPINLYGDNDDDELPSKLALHSAMGTSLTRQKMAEDRRKSVWYGNHASRNTMDESTIENAHKRGLKFDSMQHKHMDEVEQMHQLEIIRNMPVSLNVKRQLREKVLDIPTKEDDRGCCTLYCYRVKLARLRRERSCRMCCMDFDHSITLWSGSFKKIEGHFGSGVLTYFTFLKWLFQLNLFIAIVYFLFLTLPMIIFAGLNYDSDVTGSSTTTAAVNLSIECAALYTVNTTGEWYAYILDFIQGTGFMEKTVVFYGYYSATELDIPHLSYNYNMPLAYMLCVLVYFIVSLCVMVHNTAKGFNERVFMNHGDFNQFSNKVFGGWDYSIDDENNAGMIHTSLYRELDSLLKEERHRQERDGWTCKEECKIICIRILIWILVLAMLGGAGYLIYYVTTKQSELIQSTAYEGYHVIVQFMIQYMTSVTITLLNAILPFLFKLLVQLEDYTAGMSVNITLGRTVFLKLASLGILVGSIYREITCGTVDSCSVGTGTCTSLRCWETYVGQELYKLVIINLFVQVAVVFLVETPRRLIVDHCSCKLSELLGRQEFDIPKGVLDLIYMEALVWFGGFFSPLIPAMTTLIMLILFYLKYFTVVKNCKPLTTPFRASTSSEFFLVTLLVTFTLCIVPLVYCIYLVSPSKGCGPFRIYSNMYRIIPITIDTWPDGLQDVVNFFTTAAVIVPLIVILCLVIYYLVQVFLTYKNMVKTMREQLQMESRDKEFLLTKLRKLTGGETNLPKKKPKSTKPKSAKKRKPTIAEEPDSVVVVGDKTNGHYNNGAINTPPGVPHEIEQDEYY